jgi:PEP-CTERM/exosortase A-associated glycosyltransferase
MRILHLLDHTTPRHSPYALRTMAILRQQRKMGWHTIHLTGPRQAPVAVDRNHDGWHFFRTAPPGNALERLPVVGSVGMIARRLRKVILLTRPDLLHAHSPPENALAALSVGRRLGLPVVYEVHAGWADSGSGLRHRVARALDSFAARRADAVATSSESMRIRLQAGGVRRGRVTVVPNAVNLRRFVAVDRRARDRASRHETQLAHQLGLDGTPVIGFVGSFEPYEGADLLLTAAPALLATYPRLQLLLAGGGAQEQSLKARAIRLGLANRVVFAAGDALERSAAYQRLADVLVFPRLPAPQADLVPDNHLLEAMAQGCLVVASNVGAHRELVEDGRTGILFEAGKPEALAAALAGLLSRPTSWEPIRGAARWFVEFHRTWEVSVGRYAPVYQRLLERRRRH